MKYSLNAFANSKKSIKVVLALFILQLLVFALFCRKSQTVARLNAELVSTEKLLSQTLGFSSGQNGGNYSLFDDKNDALRFVKGLDITQKISCRQISEKSASGCGEITLAGEADTAAIVNFLAGLRKTKAAVRVGSVELKSLDSGKTGYSITLEYLADKKAFNHGAKQ